MKKQLLTLLLIIITLTKKQNKPENESLVYLKITYKKIKDCRPIIFDYEDPIPGIILTITKINNNKICENNFKFSFEAQKGGLNQNRIDYFEKINIKNIWMNFQIENKSNIKFGNDEILILSYFDNDSFNCKEINFGFNTLNTHKLEIFGNGFVFEYVSKKLKPVNKKKKII